MLNKILKVVAIIALIPVFLAGAITTIGVAVTFEQAISEVCIPYDPDLHGPSNQ